MTYGGLSRIFMGDEELLHARLGSLYQFDFTLDKQQRPERDSQAFDLTLYMNGMPPPTTANRREGYHSYNHRVLGEAKSTQRTYAFFNECFVSLKAGGNATFGEQLLDFHRRLAHPNFDYCRKILSLPASKDNPRCNECEVAKAKQKPLPGTRTLRSTRVIHRIHMDLGFSKDGAIFQLYVCDYSRHAWVDILKHKDENLQYFIKRKRQWENDQAPWKVAIIKTDSEPVYTSKPWKDHCAEAGISHEFSPPYKHGQNGVVERRMGTIGPSARAQMSYGNAPPREFRYAIKHTAAATNDWPTKANGGDSPRTKFNGTFTPPSRRMMQAPLFCLVYPQKYADQRTKYGDRATQAVYLGVDEHPGVFLCRLLPSGRVIYTADGRFFPK